MPQVAAAITVKAVFFWTLKAALAYAVYTLTAEKLAFGKGRVATDIRTSRRSGNEPWRIIYGEARVGGIFVFARQSGTGLRWLNLVMVLAGHQVEEIGDFYADDTLVELDGSGWATGSTTYEGKVRVQKLLGDHSATFPELVTLFGNPTHSNAWTDDHKLLGKAHVWIQLDLESPAFQGGVPNFQFQVKGKNDVYDPRDLTTKYTDNSALCLVDYLVNDKFGPGADYSTEVDEAELIAAANICDEAVPLLVGGTEPRYTCNGVLTTDDSIGDNLQKLLSSMAGILNYTEGVWRVLPAAWRAPSILLDEDDLAGPVIVQPRLSMRELFNSVKGLYVPSDLNNVATDFPPVLNASYEAEDGSKLWKELDLPMTNSPTRAQRIAKIFLERARQQITVEWPGKLRCYELRVGDVVQADNDRLGWASKYFEVGDVSLTSSGDGDDDAPQLKCALTLRETHSTVFDWSTEETNVDPAPDTNLSDISQQTAPSGLVLESDEDTVLWVTPIVVLPRIKASWTAPDPLDALAFYEVEYKEVGSSDWLAAATASKETTAVFIQGVTIGETYDVRVRAVSAYNISSSWVAGTVLVDSVSADGSSMNMLYSGGFRKKFDWKVSEPTPTKNLPTADTTNIGTAYANPANGYDDDGATYAQGVDGPTDPGIKSLVLQGFGAGAAEGYIEVLATTSIYRGGALALYKKHDGGGWESTPWGGQGDKFHAASAKSVLSPVFSVADLSTLEVEARISNSSASGSNASARVYECRFWSLGVSEYGHVQQSVGTVKGTGTVYGEVWRAFPGLNPTEALTLFKSGKHSIWQLWACAESAPDHDLEVVARNVDTDTDTVVMVIPKEDLVADWWAFAGRFTAQTDMLGTFEYRVRSKTTVPVHFTRGMVNRGNIIFPWTPNPEEQGYQGEQPFGEVGDWPLGPWTADAGGRSVLKKTQVVV